MTESVDTESLIGREERFDAVFSKKPVSVVRGDGVHVYDAEENEYLDFGASYGVMAVGHGNPSVVRAVERQTEQLTYIQAGYSTTERGRLMERLVDVTPEGLDNVFLANAGTEANEAAIKFGRASTDGSGVVAAKRGFHGRTMGSVSASWKKKYREPFEPLVPDVSFAGYNDPESLKEEVDDSTAVVLLEPVQGEGGIHPADGDYLETARDLATDHDAYLVFDEIQAGLGRTGELWSHEHYDVTPDAVTTAKSLGGGIPVSALVCREEMRDIPSGSHGGTYCGNPVSAAAARATLDYVLDNDLPENAGRMGGRLIDGLRALDSDRVVEARGMGLLVGLQVKGRSGRVLSALAGEGVLALSAGVNVVRFLPPLTVEEKHVDRVVEALEMVL